MNQQISKHAVRAMAHADSYGDRYGSIWFQKYQEKFAELIIRECADVADDNFNAGDCPVGQSIIEHFGVE